MASILHIGPPLEQIGGMATAAASMLDMDFEGEFQLHYFATTHAADGSESLTAKVGRHLGHSVDLRKLVARLEPAIVHIHTCSGPTFWRAIMDWRLVQSVAGGVAVILHIHGGRFADFYDHSNALTRQVIRSHLNEADRVIALTASWARRLVAMATRARVAVVPNAVSVPPGKLVKKVRPAGPLRISTLCPLDREKGVLDLLEAFAMVRAPGEVELCLAGPNGNLGGAEQMAAAHHPSSTVHPVRFFGSLGPTDRDDFLAQSDVFILASHVEGLPLAMLEAMSWAVPVIATNVGGIPEVIRHGSNGMLVPAQDVKALGQAIETLATQRRLRLRLGGNGRKTVEQRFTLANQQRTLATLYRELLSQAPRRPGWVQSLLKPAKPQISKRYRTSARSTTGEPVGAGEPC